MIYKIALPLIICYGFGRKAVTRWRVVKYETILPSPPLSVKSPKSPFLPFRSLVKGPPPLSLSLCLQMEGRSCGSRDDPDFGLICFCGEVAPFKTSNSQNNPGRRYFGCPKFKVRLELWYFGLFWLKLKAMVFLFVLVEAQTHVDVPM